MNKLTFGAKFEDIGKYGQIETPFTKDDFKSIGVDYEDTVKVTFLDKTLIVPFVPNYRCTHPGGVVLAAGEMFKTVPLIAFHSNFVKNNHIAVFLENDDRNIDIMVCKGIKFPIEFTFELHEKAGYHDEFKIFNLIRSNNREDYSDLSDEEYCNFRNVVVGRMAPNIFYRSSSPINNFIGRASYADKCLEKCGIKTIINLCDSEDKAKSFKGYYDTYYSKQKIIFLDTNADVTSYNFGKSILRAIRFINDNKGPYLIHCMEGQDRTGSACALFEATLGASKNQLADDYMKTYENFYKVKKGTEQYDKIIKGQLIENIASIRGFSYGVLDILKNPITVLRFLDLSDEDIRKFTAILSGEIKN